MRLIDQFHKEEVIDAYTFVFDKVNSDGSNTMLALSEDGYAFSQWTSGLYDLDGDNEHLGRRVLLSAIGARALDGFFSRLSIPQEWEEAHDIIEQIIPMSELIPAEGTAECVDYLLDGLETEIRLSERHDIELDSVDFYKEMLRAAYQKAMERKGSDAREEA